LDQEEALVQSIQDGTQGTASAKQPVEEADPSELPLLLKKLFQVIVICRGL
jgi:hypothetical protein